MKHDYLIPFAFLCILVLIGSVGATTFLEEEAGISAYVNVGSTIDLNKAKTAFKAIEYSNETYIVGSIGFTGLPEDVDAHVYVSADGWIVAYYSKYAPASKIMQWYGYGGGVITTTTLEEAIHQICLAIEFPFATIEDDIKYYDFEYPNANRMMLITEMTPSGKSYQSGYFNVEIPDDILLFEGSWSHYFSGSGYIYSSPYSNLKIDGATISNFGLERFTGTLYRYGTYTSKQLEANVLHTILIEQDTKEYSGTSGTAAVLIYKTS